MSLKAKWSLISSDSSIVKPLSNNLILSSHSLTIKNSSAFIFGGELIPRTPVNSNLSIVNLIDGSIQTLTSNSNSSTSDWPEARVGSSLVSSSEDLNNLYLWGGRGGKDMGTFSTSEDVWKYNILKNQWKNLITTGTKPEPRSFHIMTINKGILYIHAGCPSKGRSETLHSLNLTTLIWTQLPSAPPPGRGGTVLTSLPSTTPYLARFGGFAGIELGETLDLFNLLTQTWSSEIIKVEGGGEGPDKRSVHALIGLEGKLIWQDKTVVAVMAHGEREGAPAELGHDGAGFFHSDTWALLESNLIPNEFSWLKLEPSKESLIIPEARGWFASSFWEGNKCFIQGGLNEKNERLGDGWILEIILE